MGTWLDDLKGATVQNAGTPLPRRSKLNFASGFSLADNPGNDSTDVTGTGGAGGNITAVNAGDGAIVPTTALTSFFVTMNNTAVINAPSSTLPKGTLLRFYFKQDATGSRASSFAGAYANASRFVPRQGALQISRVDFISNGDGTYSLSAIDGIDNTKALNILDWGADPTGVKESRTAIQAALTYAQSLYNNTYGTSTVVFCPPGSYVVPSPIVLLDVKSVRLAGSGRRSCNILRFVPSGGGGGTFVDGPTLFVGGSGGGLPTTTALATGAGAAMALDGTSNYYVPLHDNWFFIKNLNSGLAAFSVDFFFKVTADPGSGCNLFSCSGNGPYDGAVNKQTFYVQATPKLGGDTAGTFIVTAGINVAGTMYGASIHNVTENAVHHFAMSYDGSNVRFFLDGVQQGASQPAAGTIQSTLYQHCCIGAQPLAWPDLTTLQAMPIGAIDGVRVSQTARWTAGFTAPTAKPTWDSNTLAMHNFDNEQSNGLTQFYVNESGANRPCQTPVQKPGAGPGSGEKFEIDNIGFDGKGFGTPSLIVSRTTNCTLAALDFESCSTAVRLENNCFGTDIEDIFANGFGLVGFQQRTASTFGDVDKLRFTGFLHALVATPGGRYKNLRMQPNAQSINSVMILGESVGLPANSNSNVTIDHALIDDESASPGVYVSAIHLQSLGCAEIIGGNLDVSSGSAGAAQIVTDNCRVVKVDGALLSSGGATPAIFHALRANAFPIQVSPSGCRNKTIAPWTDDPIKAPVWVEGHPVPVVGVTAHAGGGQASATQLPFADCTIGTVATAGDSCKLKDLSTIPDEWIGRSILLFNDGANSVNIFPTSGQDAGAGVDTAVAIAAGAYKEFMIKSATKWLNR
jgi:hypothetical protein